MSASGCGTMTGNELLDLVAHRVDLLDRTHEPRTRGRDECRVDESLGEIVGPRERHDVIRSVQDQRRGLYRRQGRATSMSCRRGSARPRSWACTRCARSARWLGVARRVLPGDRKAREHVAGTPCDSDPFDVGGEGVVWEPRGIVGRPARTRPRHRRQHQPRDTVRIRRREQRREANRVVVGDKHALSTPAASITLPMSSMRSSAVPRPPRRSESPCPRRSNITTRAKAVSRSRKCSSASPRRSRDGPRAGTRTIVTGPVPTTA